MKAVISKKRQVVVEPKSKDSIYDVPVLVKALAYTITTLFAFACLYPFLLVVAVSFSDEQAILANGYQLIPEKFSLEGYKYIMQNAGQILWSYGVTIMVTVVGTTLSLFIKSLYAYTISRPSFPWKSQFTFFIFFTTLFSGGMLPKYIINTQMLGLQDSFWALVLPGLCTTMHIIMMRTYMQTAIPNAVVESARMDGAGEFLCYFRIVLPMSIPIIATMALFAVTMFWNDWYRAFLYIVSNTKMIPIQLLLQRLETETKFLQQNAADFGGSVSAMQQDIPTETFKMCLVVTVVTPILIFYPFFQQYFVNGITVGAVKG
ncbi:MAG: carbohydrate ABC transporter permease [Ruminococcaceae bacterium]|nr:carbohydrate ABC transporter permease [Oscillospiraceae bacterium]